MSQGNLRIGFIGAGKMATALANGWIAAGLCVAKDCRASDPLDEVRGQFAAATGVQSIDDNRAVVAQCHVLVLAVKPQNMREVLAELHSAVSKQHLLISIAAGVTLKSLQGGLREETRIIRVMPNACCLVQASAAAYSANDHATLDDVALVDRLMNAVGRAFAVPENLLDAVTGLSGSGPAFVYAVIEALSDGGVLMGLSRPVATMLAAQTVLGSGKMVLETGLHPGALKDQVTSPGGTTIAGLRELERNGVRSGFIEAVAAATRRATELGGAQ